MDMMLSSLDTPRDIVVYDSQFTTPETFNQLYFENVGSVAVQLSTFHSIDDSQALEGASLYCMNCLQVSL